MQHLIELDQQTEQSLNSYILDSGKAEKDILANAVKQFLQQRLKQKTIEHTLKPFKIDLEGFRLDRDRANER